jgi:hypothetical protein
MTIAVRSKRNFIFAFRPTVSADAGFDQARGVGDPIKVERRCAAACSDLPRLLSGDSGALSRRAVARESDAREAEQHHCPGGGLGGGIISIEGDCPFPNCIQLPTSGFVCGTSSTRVNVKGLVDDNSVGYGRVCGPVEYSSPPQQSGRKS